jgi:inner membrane protein
MALPIAHAAAGYLVQRAERRFSDGDRHPSRDGWRRVVLFMLIGNLPDFDFFIGFAAGFPGMCHRGFSHTVLAAVLFGIVAGAFARWRWQERFAPAAIAFGAAYASHLLLDWLTIDSREPFGAQFLWPFSSAYFSAPVTIFHEILIEGRTRASFMRTVFDWPTIGVLAREVVLALGATGAWHLLEAWRARPAGDLALDGGEEDLA